MKDHIKKYIILGMPFIIILSGFMHFLYDLSGESIIAALISPVNESLWEHLKMPLLPTIIWWLLTYRLLKKKNISFRRWAFSGIISFIVCILFIIVFYYTYTGIFGVRIPILDMLCLVIGVTLGQLLALRIYKKATLESYHYYIVFTLFFIIVILFITFTYKTPQIPLFRDLETGKYGLDK